MNLDHEKAKNDKLKKKIDDLENKKKDIQSDGSANDKIDRSPHDE